MELYVSLAEPDVDAMVELRHWISSDERLPAQVRAPGETRPAEGDLGTAVDVLQLVIGSAIALGQLVMSIAQWRQSRGDQPRVRVSARRPDGVTVTIETADPDALAEVVRQLGDP
jgi:hypothetical protein